VAAIWREHEARTVTTTEPAFAAKLRQLIETAEADCTASTGPHERRLLQRVRAALAAFEAGWVVLGDSSDGDNPAIS